jgi:NAD(P)-dependent dehydrogenase (short-subunit alcohol dehydrogenase family)
VDVKPGDWDRVINTDLRGTYLCTWYAIPHMLKQKRGNVINIATVHTHAGLPGAAPYDAAKWGIVGFTKSLSVEFASRNIRVNALSPGLIDTKIWEDIRNAAPDINECLAFWKSNIPAGRVGTTKEIASAAAFLASDEASYITGVNLFADGGMTSQLISRVSYESASIEGIAKEK